MKWIFQLIFDLLVPMSGQLKQIEERLTTIETDLKAVKAELDKVSASLDELIKALQVTDVASFAPTIDIITKD
jgi:septal ring factor EnvC (AmiA/AmiB activator)